MQIAGELQPRGSRHHLPARYLLASKLSETSLLTLAHASGLMAEALSCDDSTIHMIPAM